jgi:NADH-quinone oxidoreductase subunit F
METLKTIDNFIALQSRLVANRNLNLPTLIIPAGTCGQASGANDLIRIAKREILKNRLIGRVRLRITGCHGFCEMEPSVLIEPVRTFYPKVSPGNMARIVEAVDKGVILDDLLFTDPATGKKIETQDEIPFFKNQFRTLLGFNEKVDPIRIYNYIEHGGYQALVGVLSKGDPRGVIEEIKASGLRGRGGAGFPTGLKWERLARQPNGYGKYLVCNGDEGDPGAYMDRSVLEGNPHSIIEGMLIGAYGTGANEGILYVRNEYPLAIKHIVIALRQAYQLGLLGSNILGTGFSFDLRLVRGAGAFVCGEETALIKSIEGMMGEPVQRPPFPVQRGLYGKPTLINNVETWANVPIIMKATAQGYNQIGTERNSGTKIFSLVGKVKNTGLIEVPMGITLGEIVYGIGGGSSGKTEIKAVQTGGPSGGCIPASRFDLSIDYESLKAAGSIMGSGGMIVMDDGTCMVDVAKYFMSFLKEESCGKCFSCRKGTQRMYEILDDITKGKATLAHLDLLQELAEAVKDTTLCGLGQSAPNPILSTLRYFRQEYERHIVRKQCDAFVCKDLVGAPCQSACPLGTEAWRYVAHIQRGELEPGYRVIREANPFPSVCARVCSHPCEERCRAGSSGGQPVSIRTLKRFITDRIDPSVYQPEKLHRPGAETLKVAVVGAGPAGLTAAHYLSLHGYPVTIFEAEAEPGGMLVQAIPAYRLPREVLKQEIHSLLNGNVTLRCGTVLGRDLSVDSLFQEGFRAVFLSIGAHKSRRLNIKDENISGVILAMPFLRAANLEGKQLARGNVAVIGGGNAAIDAARVALRQKGVKSVTLIYRRTREEMPAFAEEIEAALHEGVKMEMLSSPVKIRARRNRLAGIVCLRNRLGDRDETGRRKPVPVQGTEYTIPVNTMIVAVGEEPEKETMVAMGIALGSGGAVTVDPDTLCTNRQGVFAGGDLVTGPKTVVDAIAAGKKAAVMIDRYLTGDALTRPHQVRLPEVYIESMTTNSPEPAPAQRVNPPELPVESRVQSFEEVEMSLTPKQALQETKRCLRCDLDFTCPKKREKEDFVPVGGVHA